jgi:hypothetical protein
MMMAVTLGMPTGDQLFYLETEYVGISGGREAVAIEGMWDPVGMVDAGAPTNEGRNAVACRVEKTMVAIKRLQRCRGGSM